MADFAKLQDQAAAAYAEGNAPMARRLYAELVAHAPNDVRAWRRLGNLELMADHPQQALNDYGHALRLGGGNVGLWHNIAVIRVRQAEAALAQVQAQPVKAGQGPLRAASARAARLLRRAFPSPSPRPAGATPHDASGEQP